MLNVPDFVLVVHELSLTIEVAYLNVEMKKMNFYGMLEES